MTAISKALDKAIRIEPIATSSPKTRENLTTHRFSQAKGTPPTPPIKNLVHFAFNPPQRPIVTADMLPDHTLRNTIADVKTTLQEAIDSLSEEGELTLKNPNDQYIAGVTPTKLKKQLIALRTLESVVVPHSKRIHITRQSPKYQFKSGADFADFIQHVRQDLTDLKRLPSGQRLLESLDQAQGRRVSIGTANNCKGQLLESAIIHNPQAAAGIRPDDPNEPIGSDSDIYHHTERTHWGDHKINVRDTDNVGMNSMLALGHELIHSAHAAHSVSGRTPPHQKNRSIRAHPVNPEERATVGSASGKYSLKEIPTENSLRKDYNQQLKDEGARQLKDILPRLKYGGAFVS